MRHKRSTADSTLQGTGASLPAFATEDVALDALQPHPRNYHAHPDDEIAELVASIRANGVYRPIVISADNVILAGHGLATALRASGYERAHAVRMPFLHDTPAALRIVVADNEIGHLAEVDDRALSHLLRDIRASTETLLGTGYDDAMLANLLFVTRPAHEIADLQAAAQWVGLPEYDTGPDLLQVTVHFATEQDRDAFCTALALDSVQQGRMHNKHASLWWPTQRANDDKKAIRFVGREATG